jgi:hypothetical protein
MLERTGHQSQIFLQAKQFHQFCELRTIQRKCHAGGIIGPSSVQCRCRPTPCQHAQWRIAFIHHDFSHNIQQHILKPIYQIGLSTFVDDFMDYSHHSPD